jgi:hypothetical protein
MGEAREEKVEARLTRMMHYAELLLGFYRRSDIHEANEERRETRITCRVLNRKSLIKAADE